jgi:fructose-1,6-bisphosphatase/inositol monophosphatase family enzyme
MVAGYLLCESFKTPHAIDVFERRYDDCKEVLNRYEAALREQIERGAGANLDDDDRKTRYVRLLVAKANAHPGGPRQWLDDYGSLTKEMWRYFGAIRGEVHPRITVLKPIWERVVQRKLPGGMHYGHVGAMIEAAFDANAIGAKYFQGILQAVHKDEHNITSVVDAEIEGRIREVLKGHFPGYRFFGEEGGDADHSAPAAGAKRFLVDPLDGTRNFLGRRAEFCTAIACQEWDGQKWVTTDGVVAHPASGRIFWAERGHGAYVIERNDTERRAAVPKLVVDDANPLRHQLIDFSARGLDLDCQADVFRELVARNAAIRNSGSVALILAHMAGSGGNGTILTANDYDVEAGMLIAREAGASATQLDFESEGAVRTATVVGAERRIHDALVVMLKELLAKHGQRVLREA